MNNNEISKRQKLLSLMHFGISGFASITAVLFLLTTKLSVGEIIVYLSFFASSVISVWYIIVGFLGTDKNLEYVTSAYAMYILVSFAVGSIILDNSTSLVLACNFLSFGIMGAIAGMLGDGKLNSREAKICWVLLALNLALEIVIAFIELDLSGLALGSGEKHILIELVNIIQIFERTFISVMTVICFMVRWVNNKQKTVK